MPLKRHSQRAEYFWRCVMREGRSVDEVAHEHAISSRRLVQLLLALGKRRVCRLKSDLESA